MLWGARNISAWARIAAAMSGWLNSKMDAILSPGGHEQPSHMYYVFIEGVDTIAPNTHSKVGQHTISARRSRSLSLCMNSVQNNSTQLIDLSFIV